MQLPCLKHKQSLLHKKKEKFAPSDRKEFVRTKKVESQKQKTSNQAQLEDRTKKKGSGFCFCVVCLMWTFL